MSAIAKTIPFAEYRAAPGLNSSWLKRMGKSALEFNANIPFPDKPHFRKGRHVHTAVLEPILLRDQLAIWEGGLTAKLERTMSKNSTAFKTFKAECDLAGKEVVTAKEFQEYLDLADLVHGDEDAHRFLSGGKSEQSIFWMHRLGIECKARVDYLGPSWMADLKTVRNAHPDDFARQAFDLEYHVQGAFYQDAVEALTGKRVPYYIVAVEKEAPYDVAVYELPDDILDIGRSVYEDRIVKVLHCRKSGEWPGVTNGVTVLEFPDYAFTQHLDAAIDWSGVDE